MGGLFVFLFCEFGFAFFAAELYAVAEFVNGSSDSAFAYGFCTSWHIRQELLGVKVKKPFQHIDNGRVFLNKLEVKTITQKVTIPKVTPNQVYHAYTDPKLHSKFTESKSTGKPVVGGKFTAWDGYIYGKFLELEEGKRVVQEWTSTDFPDGYPPSKLELTFREAPKGTEIVMVHSEVPKEIADDAANGWVEFYWEPMKKYFKKEVESSAKSK